MNAALGSMLRVLTSLRHLFRQKSIDKACNSLGIYEDRECDKEKTDLLMMKKKLDLLL